jgi:hypothetical protein
MRISNKYFWVMNVIYTEGWRTGLTVKSVLVHKFCKYIPVFSFPLFPVSYNRKRGLELRETEKYFKEFLKNQEGYEFSDKE